MGCQFLGKRVTLVLGSSVENDVTTLRDKNDWWSLCVCVRALVRVCTCMCVYVHTYIFAYMCMYVRRQVCMCQNEALLAHGLALALGAFTVTMHTHSSYTTSILIDAMPFFCVVSEGILWSWFSFYAYALLTRFLLSRYYIAYTDCIFRIRKEEQKKKINEKYLYDFLRAVIFFFFLFAFSFIKEHR